MKGKHGLMSEQDRAKSTANVPVFVFSSVEDGNNDQYCRHRRANKRSKEHSVSVVFLDVTQ